MIVMKHVCSMRWNRMYKIEPYIWNPHLIGLIQHNNHQLVVTECHIDKTMFRHYFRKDKKFTQRDNNKEH